MIRKVPGGVRVKNPQRPGECAIHLMKHPSIKVWMGNSAEVQQNLQRRKARVSDTQTAKKKKNTTTLNITKVPPTSDLNSAANTGGEPKGKTTAYFWYKTTGDIEMATA